MFDSPSDSPTPPPVNLPTEPPDDIFSATESRGAPLADSSNFESTSLNGPKDALSAGVLRKKTGNSFSSEPATVPSPHNDPLLYPTKGPVLGKILLTLIIGLVLVGIVIGGWVVYTKIKSKPTSSDTVNSLDANSKTKKLSPIPTNPTPTNRRDLILDPVSSSSPVVSVEPTTTIVAGVKNDSILFGEPIDADKDGLDDAREKEIGTNPQIYDTDMDGLSDGDEVLLWHTDPLNPDSDGDSYKDGDEVRNGYNPLGPGKLFNNFPVASSSLKSTSSLIK